MTERKTAATALNGSVTEILQRHAKEALKEITEICDQAELDCQIGPEDYFSVTVFAQVRHHLKFPDGSFHNIEMPGDGRLINNQWPKPK